MNMLKIMIAPPASFLPNAIHDRWIILYNALNKKFGFIRHKTDVINLGNCKDLRVDFLPDGVDVIFAVISPKLINSDSFLNSINKKTKLISYIIDLHSHKKGRRFEALLKRSDLILSMANAKFKKGWPQFINKFIFWPAFFSPDERFTKFDFNEKPIMKCLFSGLVKKVYPMRQMILKEVTGRAKKLIYNLPHPGTFGANKKGAITRDAFAKMLHSYFCGITSTTLFECVIWKSVEIPAVGSLLLMNQVEDLDTMGFIPFKHYIPITYKNITKRIAECLNMPEKYRKIRLNGMDLVRSRHGFNNRINQLEQLKIFGKS